VAPEREASPPESRGRHHGRGVRAAGAARGQPGVRPSWADAKGLGDAPGRRRRRRKPEPAPAPSGARSRPPVGLTGGRSPQPARPPGVSGEHHWFEPVADTSGRPTCATRSPRAPSRRWRSWSSARPRPRACGCSTSGAGRAATPTPSARAGHRGPRDRHQPSGSSSWPARRAGGATFERARRPGPGLRRPSSTPPSRSARAPSASGDRRRGEPRPSTRRRRARRHGPGPAPGGRLALSAFSAYFQVRYLEDTTPSTPIAASTTSAPRCETSTGVRPRSSCPPPDHRDDLGGTSTTPRRPPWSTSRTASSSRARWSRSTGRGPARHRLQVRGRHPQPRAVDPQRRRPLRGRHARRQDRGPRPHRRRTRRAA
jgi:hypothetical protein